MLFLFPVFYSSNTVLTTLGWFSTDQKLNRKGSVNIISLKVKSVRKLLNNCSTSNINSALLCIFNIFHLVFLY